mmetsp:Transcript_45474/g.99003  ORF Transcript_45474/g.99003 Transcript_45474/m.99003 type:complete len:143 (+) Transcript_45474:342-770(+)
MASRLAMLPKRHVGTHALMLDSVFTYHMDMKEAREERLKPEMRSSWGGALREAAEERAEDGIALPSGNSNRSKLQQQALAADALQRAATYSNEDLGKRGDSGVPPVSLPSHTLLPHSSVESHLSLKAFCRNLGAAEAQPRRA